MVKCFWIRVGGKRAFGGDHAGKEEVSQALASFVNR